MKNTKLVATLGAVALVAAVGLGSTLAYLSDNAGPVTNTFTMGNVSFDEDFGGGLAENPVTLINGEYKIADKDKNTWVQENSYLKVTPGEIVDKNPTAFIDADSEPAYLFVRVTYSSDYEDIDFSDDFKILNENTYKNDGYWDLELDGIAAPTKGEDDKMTYTAYEIFNQVQVTDFDPDEVPDSLADIVIKAALVQHENVTETQAYGTAQDYFDAE